MAFIAPALALIALFLVVPAIWTLYLGFTNRRLTGVQAIHPEWVGLDNYREALDDKHFTGSLKVTLRYVFGSAIIGQAVLGFTLAWMFRNWNSLLRRLLELTVVSRGSSRARWWPICGGPTSPRTAPSTPSFRATPRG